MSKHEGQSPILFHGPTAQGRAAEAATRWGRVVGTYGDPRKGLDAATTREVAEVMGSPAVGDARAAVVVGPVDILTLEGVVDSLLKALEEVDSRTPRSFLWAWDYGTVRGTIRSRCLQEWCPGIWPVDPEVEGAAQEAVQAYLDKNTTGVIEAFLPWERKEGWREVAREFLMAASEALAPSVAAGDRRAILLWVSMRPLLYGGIPAHHEVVAGFLP